MEVEKLTSTLKRLTALPQETEWVEFKHNFHSPEEIGERVSALANSAALLNEPFGYMVFGVEDETHQVVGTTLERTGGILLISRHGVKFMSFHVKN